MHLHNIMYVYYMYLVNLHNIFKENCYVYYKMCTFQYLKLLFFLNVISQMLKIIISVLLIEYKFYFIENYTFISTLEINNRRKRFNGSE